MTSEYAKKWMKVTRIETKMAAKLSNFSSRSYSGYSAALEFISTLHKLELI